MFCLYSKSNKKHINNTIVIKKYYVFLLFKFQKNDKNNKNMSKS